MADKTVYAYCGGELARHISAAVAKAGNYSFSGFSDNAYDVMTSLNMRPAHLVVLEYSNDNANERGKLADFLLKKDIPFVIVCGDAKLGFAGLKDGGSNMLVIKSGQGAAEFFVSTLSNLLLSTNFGDGREQRKLKYQGGERVRQIIAMGASTGGSDALSSILHEMPADAPPIVAVMHMPPVFTKIFAEQQHNLCKISVWEAADGDRLRNGLALIARGDKHLILNRDANGFFVSLKDGDLIGGHRPSINLFFESAANCAKVSAIGVILTGMGADGASGIKKMRDAGAFTIGQDEATSVVYGMPKVAHDIGGVSVQLPLNEIAHHIMSKVKEPDLTPAQRLLYSRQKKG